MVAIALEAAGQISQHAMAAASSEMEHESSPLDTQLTLIRDGELTPAGHRRNLHEARKSNRTNMNVDAAAMPMDVTDEPMGLDSQGATQGRRGQKRSLPSAPSVRGRSSGT